MADATGSAGEQTRRQIDAWIEGVAEQARVATDEDAFYARLLAAAVQAGAALGGLVWRTDGNAPLELLAVTGLPDTPLTHQPPLPGHARFLAEIRRTGRCGTAGPEPENSGQGFRPAGSIAVACPVRVDQRVLRIVEVLQRPDLAPDALRGYAAVLETLCEVAADFHRQSELRALRAREDGWRQADHFVEQLHRQQLDPEAVAFCIANDGRTLVGCDRIAVAVRRRGAYRVLAVSGVDSPEVRARTVRSLRQLIGQAARWNQAVWHPEAGPELPPELDAALRDYIDVAHCRSLAIVPLSQPAVNTGSPEGVRSSQNDSFPPAGALVFETFAARTWDNAIRQRIELVVRHGGAALDHAERYGTLPLVRRLAAWRSPARSTGWARYVWALLTAAIVAAVLVLVPADFAITCQGTAQPAARRQVFAPFDGRIAELSVGHGDRVHRGQLLATIDSPELALQYARLLGEIQVAAEALNAVQAERLGPVPAADQQRQRAGRLAAEEQRLKAELETLQRQQRLLEQQRDKQKLTSPIAGEILTWQLAELLEARPVQRGQVLMTVGEIQGAWVLELRVPDRDVLAIRQAQQRMGPELQVSFLSAADPGTRHRGRLQQLSMLVEADADEQLAAWATVQVEPGASAALRPGAGVTARIQCGRRPLGYVWLRDLIGAVRRWLFV